MTADYECPKCKTEYEASGSDADDAGEKACERCGFRFAVEIEYFPSYIASCVQHEYGPWQRRETPQGRGRYRACVHCGACEMQEKTE